MMPDLGSSGPMTDYTYTDRYIVVSKHVERKTVTSGGMLGSANPDETPTLVTRLMLVSNGSGDKSVIEDLNSLIQSLKKAKLIPEGVIG